MAAEWRIREFKAQEIANTAWAFATVGLSDENLFAALAMAGAQRVWDFKPQDLTNTAWAFARVV